ncbi:MAG: T9SS type A sorting domain-containing protein [Candidatus Marinimicrobia bacterium]|nr:T9SS type A sorting domain-containing protein [Candidatus Neomarinimicrobiota bacterium]MCF7828543.1 T9SS type A sorting domain-containing protein [Candidatus Neomarinimicrobiota bacterium]MCF7882034.1 T9SS type A sorting domain-containing protein [Candidatus Neomarinimicrobiota bacterium]
MNYLSVIHWFKLVTIILFGFSSAFGQTTITLLDFETTGGYTTSITEFTDGDYDYFLRTDGSDITGESFSNIQGSYYFAAQDIDGENAPLPVNLTIDNVDITGYSSLQIKIYLAEDDDGTEQDWDGNDYVHIDYDLDNSGTYNSLLWIENEGDTTNAAPLIDTNFDGSGDGTEITDTFTQFTADISGIGSLLDIQITFNLDSGGEDIAIDNIEIVGSSSVKPEPTNHATSFTANASGYHQIDLSWNDNNGAQAADGFLIVGKTGSGSFYTPADGIDPDEDTDWSDGDFKVQVDQGAQSYNLNYVDDAIAYDFRIYPYTNYGADIDFKTDGTVPSANVTMHTAPNAWINEIHYDNVSTDTSEGVEAIIEYPGDYSLSDFSITFYNGGDQKADDSHALDTFTEGSSANNFVIYSKMISGIQNGAPDGLALSHDGNLIQFLSYEGTFTAADGVASGHTSIDIGVSEDGSRPATSSLQLVGDGTQYSDFIWDGPLPATFGYPNNDGNVDQSLPVSLVSFTAEVKNDEVILTWITESEIENQGFILERKETEPGTYLELDSFRDNPALQGAGSTAERHSYTYTDRDIKIDKTYWYRLTDVSFDGVKTVHDDWVLQVKVTRPDLNRIDLEPAYPNPFNAQTRLTYHLPKPTEVRFELYNPLGMKLATLLEENKTAGTHNLYVSLPEYPSGIYFVQMSAVRFRKTQKLLLLR